MKQRSGNISVRFKFAVYYLPSFFYLDIVSILYIKKHLLIVESNQLFSKKVIGPSLHKDVCMSAPNFPNASFAYSSLAIEVDFSNNSWPFRGHTF